MELPTSKRALERFVEDQIPESIELDYKASPAIRHDRKDEIAKDVCAFANSAGGMIIYGIEEREHVPVRIDDGVDHKRFSREWLESIILSRVAPRLAGLEVAQIPLSTDRSAFALRVQQSLRGAHQLMGEGRYYKRYNFMSVPMEHYEIEDVRLRTVRVAPLIEVAIEVESALMTFVAVRNVGEVSAENVTFNFDPSVPWPTGEPVPRLFGEGAKSIPPGREMRFIYGTFPEIVSGEKGLPQATRATVSYYQPLAETEIVEEFYLDFLDFMNSSPVTPPVLRAADKVNGTLKDIRRDLQQLVRSVQRFEALGGPTGLHLSRTAIQSLNSVFNEESLPPLRADYADPGVFIEVLRVDRELAFRLFRFFRGQTEESLDDLEGMTPEIAEQIRASFYSPKLSD